jgi:hypothetical protein
MTKDISIEAILAKYDLPEFSHAEALAVTEIADRTLQVWFQRGYLDAMGMTAPGRGKHRKYTLGQLLFLCYMRRLTFLSIPVAEAAQIASVFLPVRHLRGARPDASVTKLEVQTILPALEAAQDPTKCEGKVFGLVYRTVDREWRNRVATAAEMEAFGGLLAWINGCTLDSMAIVTDLGQVTRITLVRVMDTLRRRRQ